MTPAQRERCFALLRSGGDLWAAVLELNALRRRRGDAPVVNYQELCRELSRAGVARRARTRGQAGSRRGRKYRATTRRLEQRHRRRVAQTNHEAARAVIEFAVAARIGTFVVGDPRGLLKNDAGRRQNLAVSNWRPGQAISALSDKAHLAGIAIELVDERGRVRPARGARPRWPSQRADGSSVARAD